MKIGDVVKITWDDTTSEDNEDDWKEDVNIDTLIAPMETIGTVHKLTEKSVLLVMEFDLDNNKRVVRSWEVIPRAIITKVEVVEDGVGKETQIG